MKKLKIELELTTKTHVTIGMGENQFFQTADIIQLRRLYNQEKRSCIPATTLKGLLRASAVQIAHFILGDNEKYCTTVNTEELSKCDGCIICNLFGSINKPSKIYCEDLFPINKAILELHKLTQTSIERKSGKSKKGSLFTKERIPPNTTFSSILYIEAFNNSIGINTEILILFALKNLEYCSFGNGDGLIEVRTKKIDGFSRNNELVNNLIERMSDEKST
ncbi:MAG: RAMP superfamily CRISPR-associated protein [Candidatus Lokiarchaeia archaeon]